LGGRELLSAITFERSEDLTGQALTVHPHRYVPASAHIAHDEREVLVTESWVGLGVAITKHHHLELAEASGEGGLG
jgi:hypothetical protein